MIQSFEEIIERAIGHKDVKIAVARAENEEVLEAVEEARKLGIAKSILVGQRENIEQLMNKLSISIENFELVEAYGEEECSRIAVELVADGYADLVMKGLVQTSTILHAVLNKEKGLRSGKILSHVAVFDLPRYHKLLVLSDPAMNIAPDLETKKNIIFNALEVTKALEITRPKVAVLAAKEKVSEKMPATIDAKKLSEMDFGMAIVDGPLALDNAISRESVEIKGIDSPVGGDADVLIVPQIESGNVLYKSFSFLHKDSGAGVIVGAKKPVVLISRADTTKNKLNSIALAVLMSRCES